MIGVILAAGRGSRLGVETEALPKPLIGVAGRTCLDFAIDALLAVVDRIVVVTGYRAELVEDHIATHWSGAPVQTVRNLQLEAGNLTSLGAARALIGPDPFILTNADHLFPLICTPAILRSYLMYRHSLRNANARSCLTR